MNLERLKPLVPNINILTKEHITIVGCGALGSVTAELMVRNGIGNITLIDNDIVEDHNLQRQNYVKDDVGKQKVNVLYNRLISINPNIKIIIVQERLNTSNVHLIQSGLVLDCTDNWYTRKLINRYSTHWVFASAIKNEGMVQYLNKKPCMECWLETDSEEHCEDLGVYNATTHIIASIQSHLALRVLTSSCDNTLYHFTLPGKIHAINTPCKTECQGCFSTPLLPKEQVQRVCHNMYKTYTHIKGEFQQNKQYTLFKDGTIHIYADNKNVANTILSKILTN